MKNRVKSLSTTIAILFLSCTTFAQDSGLDAVTGITELDAALDVYFAKSESMPYDEAAKIIRSYGEQGNIHALRADVIIWMMRSPGMTNPISYTNAYFGNRALSAFHAGARVPLVDASEFSQTLGALAEQLFRFSAFTDEITDERTCILLSQKRQDVWFGADNNGIFVESGNTLDDSRFAEFAIRVDDETPYFGVEPEEITNSKVDFSVTWDISGAVKRGELTLEQGKEKIQSIARDKSRSRERAKRIYVAKSHDVSMEKLLRELSLGSRVLVRAVLLDGTMSTHSWPLNFSNPETDGPEKMSIFDLYAYQFVDCHYSAKK